MESCTLVIDHTTSTAGKRARHIQSIIAPSQSIGPLDGSYETHELKCVVNQPNCLVCSEGVEKSSRRKGASEIGPDARARWEIWMNRMNAMAPCMDDPFTNKTQEDPL